MRAVARGAGGEHSPPWFIGDSSLAQIRWSLRGAVAVGMIAAGSGGCCGDGNVRVTARGEGGCCEGGCAGDEKRGRMCDLFPLKR